MTTSRQSAIDAILDEAVRGGAVPNVVAVAAGRDGVIYEGACGARLPEQPDSGAVGPDTPYRLMAMTRPITTVAALTLVEEGKIDLDAPVEEYVAEFARVQVLVGIENRTPILRPPASKATVAQLITHTSGLGYWFWERALVDWEMTSGNPNPLSGLATIFDAPMVSDPGTRFVYGISTEWLGRVVEAIEGRPLPEVIERRVTGPLGMRDTGFTLAAERRAALVPVCMSDDAGRWQATEIELPRTPDYWSGAEGLYGTPRDYVRFMAMLLGEGQAPDWAGGARVLGSESVAGMFRDQTGGVPVPERFESTDPRTSGPFVLGPGRAFGHGLLVATDDQPRRRRAGTGGWGGIFNTRFWVDPTTGVAAAMFCSLLPHMGPGPVQTFEAFERMLYASL